MTTSENPAREPRYDLSVYRNFIREAAPYVSLVIGRRILASQAETLSEAELKAIALVIDSRVDDLAKRPQ